MDTAIKRKVVVAAVTLGAILGAWADDPRVCGEPARNAKNQIIRRPDVVLAFRALYPCPSTGLSRGPCPGWSVDHVIPLACGGCDSVSNLQWLKNTIKSCAGTECKDRWERRIYCRGDKS